MSIILHIKITKILQKFGKKIGLYFANRKPLSEENSRVVCKVILKKLKAHNPFKMRKSENALFFNGFQTVLKNPFKASLKRGKFMSGWNRDVNCELCIENCMEEKITINNSYLTIHNNTSVIMGLSPDTMAGNLLSDTG